jgi:uncharacterized membrane protein
VVADATTPDRLTYLLKILGPFGFLPLLAPWAFVMALPAIALNFFSTYSSMYSGSNQYNVDIACMLMFSAIDALAWLVPAAEAWLRRLRPREPATNARSGVGRTLRPMWAVVALIAIGVASQGPSLLGHIGHHLDWPVATAHTRLGYQVLTLIPPNASVSAQTTLVPHLSQRAEVHEFPDDDNTDQYIFLDATADYYPFASLADYSAAVSALERSPGIEVVVDRDGYLLLRRA